MTVTLECDDGEFVATIVLPISDPMPMILIWGERAFKTFEELSYREVISYTIPLEAIR